MASSISSKTNFKSRANDYTTKQLILLKDVSYLKLCTNDYILDLEKISFYYNPKERQCQTVLKLPHNWTHLTCQQSNTQNSPSQFSNCELPNVQAGFRKGRGTRDQIANIWRRKWHPTPVLLPGKSHGWRSLVGCSPWSREESDTTE